MIVVGVGCGPGMMTEDAIAKVRTARKLYGSERAIKIAQAFIPTDAVICPIKDYSRLGELPEDTIVLSTGDPMLAGLGHLGIEVIPGISSMQCAFSRLRLPLTKAVVVDGHGRKAGGSIREALDEVVRGRIPFILTEPGFDLGEYADMISMFDIEMKIILCENLGYPNEVISFGNVERPPFPTSRLFSLILVKEG